MSKNFITFLRMAEKLKTTLRHSWTSNPQRQESTAEHSWMLGLMAIILFEDINPQLDKLKILKILLIHDLAEAITGDIPAFEVSKRKKKKKESELNALKKITKPLSPHMQQEILALWHEYENRETWEGKFAHRLDKIEAGFQHAAADISTWDQNDFDYHGAFYSYDYSGLDASLLDLRDEVIRMSISKVRKAHMSNKLNKTIKDAYKKIRKNI